MRIRFFALALVQAGSVALATQMPPPVQWDAAFADGDQIVLVDVTTERVTTLRPPTVRNISAARLSPEGNRVAFAAVQNEGEFPGLFVMTLSTSSVERIGTNPGWHRNPTWTPDGQKIIFALHMKSIRQDRRKQNDPAILYEADLETKEIRRLPQEGFCHYFPNVSSNGRFLLFTQTDCAVTWNIARMDLRTGATRQLTPGISRDYQPVLSPDGSQFAYFHLRGDRGEIRVAPLSGGSGQQVATTYGLKIPQLHWLPRGNKIAWFDKRQVQVIKINEEQSLEKQSLRRRPRTLSAQ